MNREISRFPILNTLKNEMVVSKQIKKNKKRKGIKKM